MALSSTGPEADRLAREAGRISSVPLRDELAAIRQRCAALPVLDNRSDEEILGYDGRGLEAEKRPG